MDFLKGAINKVGDFVTDKCQPSSLDDISMDKIVMALKEALVVGTRNAVEETSKENGFLHNPQICVPIPPLLQRPFELLQRTPFDSNVTAFHQKLNHAAEKASKVALDVFFAAVNSMTFDDAKTIVKGTVPNAATLHFERSTRQVLHDAFKPLVAEVVCDLNLISLLTELQSAIQKLPLVGSHLVSTEPMDLDEYVTGKALDGLFLILGQKEMAIRQTPAARVTPLIAEVFKFAGSSNPTSEEAQ